MAKLPESWSEIEPRLRGMPGGATLCKRVRTGSDPWPEIARAISYCTHFPTAAFDALLASGRFDVRWPLTFAAYFLGSCGATVDPICARFLTAAGLWDEALEVLPEYTEPVWLNEWRESFIGRQRSGHLSHPPASEPE